LKPNFVILVLATGLYAGCARFEPQPISPAQTAALLDARRLDDPGLKKFLEKNSGHEPETWPLASWDLNSLTLAAFYFHPDLDVARAQWRLAEAGVKTAGARPNPSVTVTPAYDSQIPDTPSPWIVPVSLDIPIETAGKRAKRMAEAQDASKSAYWNLITTAWQIRSGVRASLLDFIVAKQRAALQANQLATQEQIVKLLQQRFDAGEISRPDLTTAQIALNKARLDANDTLSQLAAARSHLAEALGVSTVALDGMNLAFDISVRAPEELTSADARRVALLGRSDIRGALADYAAAQDDLQLQIAKQYPDVHLGPGYAWNSGNVGDNEWSLGLTLELPILDQNQGPIAEAKARRELVAAQFTALQAKIIGEIDRAVAGYHVAAEQLATGDTLLAAEQKQRESATAQLKAGAADVLDSASAQAELDNALLAHLDGQVKFQESLGALEDALQRPADAMEAAVAATAMTNLVERPFRISAGKEKQP
jgi:outer membrane protein, heavy metal efflux system